MSSEAPPQTDECNQRLGWRRFIETGGFKEDQAGDWSTSYYVMKRARK